MRSSEFATLVSVSKALVLSLTLLLTLIACGQKGALYLPQEQATQEQEDQIQTQGSAPVTVE